MPIFKMGKAKPEEDITDFLDVLYSPTDGNAVIDIVAVHGLNPLNTHKHALGTWKAANDKVWLRDFLPLHIPDARVLLFGYNSNVAFNTSSAGLDDAADQLLRSLRDVRKKAPERPIIFICHSLGGLLVKQALVSAVLAEKYTPIYRSTYGIMFFATPHKGGHGASLGDTAASIAGFLSRNPKNDIMQSLKANDAFPKMLRHNYRHQLGDYSIVSFYEAHGMKGKVIVDKESATFGLSTKTEEMICIPGSDHSTVCKFESQTSQGYRFVQPRIDELVEEALEKVRIRDARIEAGDAQVREQLLCNVTLENISDELSTVRIGMQNLQAATTEREDRESRERIIQRRKAIVQWLSPPDTLSSHSRFYQKHVENTGTWLLEQSQTFQNWKVTKGSWIWMHGVQGCGKSVLSSMIITHLMAGLHSRRSVLYFYVDFAADKKDQTPEKMITSFIFQLFADQENSHAAKELDELFEICGNEHQRLTLQQLLEILLGLLNHGRETFLVIDGLDESPHLDGLLETIQAMQVWELENVHILISSQMTYAIKKVLDEFIEAKHQICVHEQVPMEDIKVLIRTTLEQDRKFARWKNQPKVRDDIENWLSSSATPLFLLVVRQLAELSKYTTAPRLYKALEILPKSLDESWNRTLNNIEEMYREDAKKILQWLVYSIRPLSCEELIDVLAVTSDDNGDLAFHEDDKLADVDDLLLYCDGMLNIHDTEPTMGTQVRHVRLAHGSLKEYLLSLGNDSAFHMPSLASNISIAETCLLYLLSFPELSKLPTKDTIPPQSALTSYAATAWIHHMRIPGRPKTGPWDRLLSRFVSNRALVLNWGWILFPAIAGFGSPAEDASKLGAGLFNEMLHDLEEDTEAQLKNSRIRRKIEKEKEEMGLDKPFEFLRKLEDEKFREGMRIVALDRGKCEEFMEKEYVKLMEACFNENDATVFDNELFCAFYIYIGAIHKEEEEDDESTEESLIDATFLLTAMTALLDTIKDEAKKDELIKALEKHFDRTFYGDLLDIRPTFTAYKRACYEHITKIGCQMIRDRPHIACILDAELEVPDWGMNVDELRCTLYCMLFASVVEALFVKDVEVDFDFSRQVGPGDAAISIKETNSRSRIVFDAEGGQQMWYEEETLQFGVIIE